MFDDLIPLYLYLGYPIERPEHLYDYLMAAQGIIKRVETRYVSADALLVPIQEKLTGLRLRKYPVGPLRLKVPRIPERLLQEALADARRNLDLEHMYHFRIGEKGWQVTRPQQEQSLSRVGYLDRNQAGIALELHSHHRMPAYFSPTDDGDEQGGRFYAVMGRLDRPNPELTLRLGMYGPWLPNVPALSLFEGLGPFVEVYDDPFADYAEGYHDNAYHDDAYHDDAYHDDAHHNYGDEPAGDGRSSFANLFRWRSK